MMLTSTFRTLAALGIVLCATAASAACPFCAAGGKTLTEEAAQATLILLGTPSNAQLNAAGGFDGTTELKIDAVIKDHPFIKGKDKVTINRYIAIDPNSPKKYLVYCDVYKDKLDPYLGIPVEAGSKVAEYLKGALAMRDKDAPTRLAFFFKYLDSSDMNLSDDAYREFANADYKDYRPLAEKLEPEKIVKWLKDPNTPASRFGLYGSLLGHCGKEKHAQTIRDMLDEPNPNKRFSTGVDGMLAGYVLLAPKAGWEYVRDIFKEKDKEFLVRYAALRTARFFWEYRGDVIKHDDVVKAVALMLPQDDIADLVIEDLRKWGRWELCGKVLSLFDQKSHDVPIIRRAILRFALQCPAKECPDAARFVEAQRKRDAEWVKDVEELLQLEVSPPKPPVSAPRAGAGPSKPLSK